MKSRPTWQNIHSGLRQHLEAATKTASLSTEQGTKQTSDVATPDSDPEVKDILPNGGQPGSASTDLVTERGAGVGETLPDQPSFSEEEKVRKETSPGTKLAADILANSFASRLTKAAQLIKAANEGVTAEFDSPAAPSEQLGHGHTVDTSDKVPKTESSGGVTQTEISTKTPERKLEQGTELKSAGSVDVDEVARKIARFTAHVQYGYAKTAAILEAFSQGLEQQAQPSAQEQFQAASIEDRVNSKVAELQQAGYPADQIEFEIRKMAAADADNIKLAEAQQQGALSAAQEILNLGFQQGILSQKQAEDMAIAAGLYVPAPAMGSDILEKTAMCRQAGMSDEWIFNYYQKVAMNDPAAAGMAPEGAPAPEEIQQALGSVIQELMQAVEAGQMTEEQAIDILKQEGLPIDQILAGAGGDPGMGGDPAAGGMPPEMAGGMPPEMAAGPEAGGMPPEAAGGMPPEVAAGAPPEASGGGEKAPEGGDKKPEGDKSDKDKDDKKDKKDDDKKDDKGEGKEASGEVMPGDPLAGDSVGTTPEGQMPAEGSPEGAPGEGGAPDLQSIIADLQALVAEGRITPEKAEEVMQIIASGGAGAPPEGDPAAGAMPPEAAPEEAAGPMV